jgi:WD40 repeat protein
MKRFLSVFLIIISFTVICIAQNSNSQIIRLKYKLDVGNPNDRVHFAFFSLDGKRVLLINENSTQVWSSETGKLLLTFPETIQLKNGNRFDWQPNGTKILQYKILPDKNSAAYLWDTESGKLIAVLSETRGVKLAEWNKNGGKILTVGDYEYSIDDKRVSFSIRDENGRQIRTDDIRTFSLLSIRFANGEDNIIASYRVDYRYDFKGKPIRVYKAETGALARSYDQELKKTPSFDYAVFSAESPDGRFICGQIYTSKGVACWKNSGSESPIYYFLDRKETGDISFLSFSRDSKSFAISKPKSKVIELIDAETGKAKITLENPNKARLYFYPYSSGFSPASGDSWSLTGKFFVATNFEKEANVWNAQTGKLIAKLPVIYDDDHDWFVGTLVADYETFSFHPSEKVLLSVSNQVVRLWKPETGQLLQEIKETSKDKSQSLFQRFVARWSPDGNLLMTAANENKSVLLWEVRP